MGGAETTGTPVGRPLPDARQAPPGVVAVAQCSSISGRYIDGEGGRGIDVRARGEGERDCRRDGGRGGGT